MSKLNIIDHTISYFSPVAGLKRAQARNVQAQLNTISTAYDGAAHSKKTLWNWLTGSGDSDSDDLPSLPKLRDRSIDLYQNAPLAKGAINSKRYNIIGSGLRYQSSINEKILGISGEAARDLEKKMEFEFNLWGDSIFSDYEDKSNFREQTVKVFMGAEIFGDIFVLTPKIKRETTPYTLSIKLVEANACTNPTGANSRTLSGVENTERGSPKNYYFKKSSAKYSSDTVKIPAFSPLGRRNVIHYFESTRPNQRRGIPSLSASITLLKTIKEYTDYEATAALISSAFTVFIEKEAGQTVGGTGTNPLLQAQEDAAPLDMEGMQLEPGMIAELPPGTKISTANPGRPNTAFDSFVQAMFTQLAVANDIPKSILIKEFSASYSAIRGELGEFWKYIHAKRIHIVDGFCDPILELLIDEAVSLGRLNLPGYTDDIAKKKAYLGAVWKGPTRAQINPLAEVRAANEACNGALSNRDLESYKLNESDFDTNVAKGKRENELMLDAGFIKKEEEDVI